MARRIVIAMLVLIGTLLVTTVVPLGLITASRDRDSFRQDTLLSAQSLAGVAEESLGDHAGGRALTASLASARRTGDSAWVYGDAGQLVAATTPVHALRTAGSQVPPVPLPVLAAALRRGGISTWSTGDSLRVVIGMRTLFDSDSTGAVVYSRGTEELNERVHVLWAWLIAVAAVGLLAGTVIAVGFARWVARPLSALDTAAGRLGAGELSTRSAAGHGPPEVRRLASTFNTMAGRLESLIHGHRAMMADVSHQLRTPLAALRLRLDLLAQDADTGTAAELAGAQGEIARLSRLVDGLLAIARAENAMAPPARIDVAAVIRDRVAAWRPVAEERGVWLAADCPVGVQARLGEGHLEQALDNLLANALDAVPSGGHVTVGAAASGGGARVTVADDGPGMSPQHRQAAFRRFTGASGGGAGLGLAIVHRLVTAGGGSAALADTPGGGLTVTLDLPVPGADR
jgi:signal transduction histidine kinase